MVTETNIQGHKVQDQGQAQQGEDKGLKWEGQGQGLEWKVRYQAKGQTFLP